MSRLHSIPTTLKRFLNANFKAFYQLHWVDEELNLTEAGEQNLMNLLFEKFETELGTKAKAEVKRVEEEEKENK